MDVSCVCVYPSPAGASSVLRCKSTAHSRMHGVRLSRHHHKTLRRSSLCVCVCVFSLCVCVCELMCVCLCVCARAPPRERERVSEMRELPPQDTDTGTPRNPARGTANAGKTVSVHNTSASRHVHEPGYRLLPISSSPLSSSPPPILAFFTLDTPNTAAGVSCVC